MGYYLFRVTTIQPLVCEQRGKTMPQGASVEVSSDKPGQPTVAEIKEAFYRKYGVNPDTTRVQCACKVEKLG